MYRKRERTQNWSVEEKKYLLELVKSRLDVLENKRIDSASSAMKGMAWQDIHAAFAARFGNDRDAHRVREQWRRMKGQSRTEMMEFAERVRNYGAEVATNQRWPSALSEDVWKTLEAARKLNEFQQGYGGGEDVNSPVTMMDDDEDDGDDGYDPDRSGAGVADRMSENGIKLEPDGDRYDGNHHLRDHGRDYDADVRIMGHTVGHGMGEDGGHGLMNMLRPKVELNDVPDVDTSMVPAGLSITTVKLGSGGQKRRMVDRQQHQQQQQQQQQQPHDLASRTNPWDSPGQAGGSAPRDLRELRELRDVRDLHALALLGPGHGGHGGHGNAARPSRSATPQQHHAVNGHPPTTVQESKRLELRRRLEMMEEEHDAKMALLRVEKETAEVRRRIALQEEADAASALTCRSCGGERTSTGAVRPVRGEQRARRVRRASGAGGGADADADADAPHALPLSDALRGGGSGGSGSSSGTGPSSPASPADSRGASEHGGVVNGLKHEDDSSQDQVRFAGGLGEPGSGAGKGGGSGGSIREAGGSMGKREAAFEEEYFYKQQKEQLKKLKSDLADEIGFHEEQIKRHQEAIARHKQRVDDLDKDK